MSDWRDSKLSIKEKLHYILTNDGNGQDVQFLVGPLKTVISAHSFILNLTSRQLEDLIRVNGKFDKKLGKMTNKIELPDMEPEALKFILKNIYTNAPVEEIKAELVLDVWSAAKHLGIHHLSKNCGDLLLHGLNLQNAIRCYNESSKMDISCLKTKAMDFIFRNATKIIASLDFYKIQYENLAELVKSDYLFVDEVFLFNRCVCWAKEECKRVDVDSNDAANLRNVLANIVYLIRYPLMTMENFTMHVVSTNILLAKEVIDLYRYFSLSNSKLKDTDISLQQLTTFSCSERKCLTAAADVPENKKFTKIDAKTKLLDEVPQVQPPLAKTSSQESHSKSLLDDKNISANFVRPSAQILNAQLPQISQKINKNRSKSTKQNFPGKETKASEPSKDLNSKPLISKENFPGNETTTTSSKDFLESCSNANPAISKESLSGKEAKANETSKTNLKTYSNANPLISKKEKEIIAASSKDYLHNASSDPNSLKDTLSVKETITTTLSKDHLKTSSNGNLPVSKEILSRKEESTPSKEDSKHSSNATTSISKESLPEKEASVTRSSEGDLKNCSHVKLSTSTILSEKVTGRPKLKEKWENWLQAKVQSSKEIFSDEERNTSPLKEDLKDCLNANLPFYKENHEVVHQQDLSTDENSENPKKSSQETVETNHGPDVTVSLNSNNLCFAVGEKINPDISIDSETKNCKIQNLSFPEMKSVACAEQKESRDDDKRFSNGNFPKSETTTQNLKKEYISNGHTNELTAKNDTSPSFKPINIVEIGSSINKGKTYHETFEQFDVSINAAIPKVASTNKSSTPSALLAQVQDTKSTGFPTPSHSTTKDQNLQIKPKINEINNHGTDTLLGEVNDLQRILRTKKLPNLGNNPKNVSIQNVDFGPNLKDIHEHQILTRRVFRNQPPQPLQTIADIPNKTDAFPSDEFKRYSNLSSNFLPSATEDRFQQVRNSYPEKGDNVISKTVPHGPNTTTLTHDYSPSIKYGSQSQKQNTETKDVLKVALFFLLVICFIFYGAYCENKTEL